MKNHEGIIKIYSPSLVKKIFQLQYTWLFGLILFDFCQSFKQHLNRFPGLLRIRYFKSKVSIEFWVKLKLDITEWSRCGWTSNSPGISVSRTLWWWSKATLSPISKKFVSTLCFDAFDKGSYIYDVLKKWPILWPPTTPICKKEECIYLFKNNRIRKYETNFKTSLPLPFHVDVINVWSLSS